MDPNATLETIRELGQQILAGDVGPGHGDVRDAAEDMAAAFDALDDWLCAGGFPPDAWSQQVSFTVQARPYDREADDAA